MGDVEVTISQEADGSWSWSASGVSSSEGGSGTANESAAHAAAASAAVRLLAVSNPVILDVTSMTVTEKDLATLQTGILPGDPIADVVVDGVTDGG